MELNRLYLITDRNQIRGRSLVSVVEQALKGGVKAVQLREKDLSGRELLGLAMELRELTTKYNAKLLINDRVDIAISVEADGVHLGRQSFSVKDARRAFEDSSLIPYPPSSFIIGVSTHSLVEALEAERDGADFVTFGPVRFTPSKAVYGEPVGIDKLHDVVKALNIPVFAIGGMKKGNMEEVLNAGCYGVAVISAIMSANDVKIATEEILQAITDHRL